MRKAGLVVLVVAGALLGSAPDARAASIVYIKGGNVWLANPDGTGEYQVTLDGTSAQPYRSPSQADDGTIVAQRFSRLFRMKQNGEWLNEPISTSAPGGGPLSPAVSPNGALVAFDYITVTPRPPSQGGGFIQEVIYSHSNRFTPREEIDPAGLHFNDPSWIGDGRTMLFYGTQVWTEPVGQGDETEWFADTDFMNLWDGETAGDVVVAVRGDSREYLQFYRRADPSFSTDPTQVCYFEQPAGEFRDPTLAPGGTAVAWEENDGINASDLPGGGCAGANPRLIIPGGSQPDFGPANVTPGPRAVCCKPPPPPPPEGLTLSATVKRQVRLAALLRGLRVRFRCSRACGVVAQLKVARRPARRYGLPRTLGRGTGGTAAGAERTLVVKLSRRAKQRLRKARRLRRLALTLELQAGGGGSPLVTTRRTLIVRR